MSAQPLSSQPKTLLLQLANHWMNVQISSTFHDFWRGEKSRKIYHSVVHDNAMSIRQDRNSWTTMWLTHNCSIWPHVSFMVLTVWQGPDKTYIPSILRKIRARTFKKKPSDGQDHVMRTFFQTLKGVPTSNCFLLQPSSGQQSADDNLVAGSLGSPQLGLFGASSRRYWGLNLTDSRSDCLGIKSRPSPGVTVRPLSTVKG